MYVYASPRRRPRPPRCQAHTRDSVPQARPDRESVSVGYQSVMLTNQAQLCWTRPCAREQLRGSRVDAGGRVCTRTPLFWVTAWPVVPDLRRGAEVGCGVAGVFSDRVRAGERSVALWPEAKYAGAIPTRCYTHTRAVGGHAIARLITQCRWLKLQRGASAAAQAHAYISQDLQTTDIVRRGRRIHTPRNFTREYTT